MNRFSLLLSVVLVATLACVAPAVGPTPTPDPPTATPAPTVSVECANGGKRMTALSVAVADADFTYGYLIRGEDTVRYVYANGQPAGDAKKLPNDGETVGFLAWYDDGTTVAATVWQCSGVIFYEALVGKPAPASDIRASR